MERLHPEDWCAAGLALLQDEGGQGLTLEALCGRLRRTKGSFYHHFRDMDDFLGALLDRWEAALLAAPFRLAGVELRGGGRQRLHGPGLRLPALRSDPGPDPRLDGALRAWALWDPRARMAMARVDRDRLARLAELYRLQGHPEPWLAAELEYAAFVGAQQLGFFGEPQRTERLGAALRPALFPRPARRTARP